LRLTPGGQKSDAINRNGAKASVGKAGQARGNSGFDRVDRTRAKVANAMTGEIDVTAARRSLWCQVVEGCLD
jgi:hypothetical protein